MAAVTVNNHELTDEASFRNRLNTVNAEIRRFCAGSHPATRTPEQWEWLRQKQATAAWLEDSLRSMQKRKARQARKRQTVRDRFRNREDGDE